MLSNGSSPWDSYTSRSWVAARRSQAAAELPERVCHGIELDPKYVDVVIERQGAPAEVDPGYNRVGLHFQQHCTGIDSQCVWRTLADQLVDTFLSEDALISDNAVRIGARR
jgi:hypothetical protein